MMRKLLLTALLLACATIARAQQGYTYAPGQNVYPGYQQWEQNAAHAALPTTPTTITGTTGAGGVGVYLNKLRCNTGSTSDAITIVDATTGAFVWRSITIAANSVYAWPFDGEHVPGGVKWSSSAGSVVCWLQGGY